jgi:hypothetical protein
MSLMRWCRLALVVLVMSTCNTAFASEFRHPDHYEFDATLAAPFRASDASWPFVLQFDYPGAGEATSVAWVVEALDPRGQVIASRYGTTPIHQQHAQVSGRWNGRNRINKPIPAGYYTLRLRAVPTVELPSERALTTRQRVELALAAFADEVVEQSYDVMVGEVAAARVTPRAPLPTAHTRTVQSVGASNGLPYTIYYGNLHSQTNHSDGGTPVASCTGAATPQTGSLGPADAYAMMQTQAGGDFLLASEHNHMYDGSTGTNSSAVPANAIALFQSGEQAAADYTASHPGFLAMYGLEWGVISNGGHLNLINADALAEWEYNGSGQLIGEVLTPKSDYAALYATMAQRGWIGQFNHPSTSQFIAHGTAMGYDANGDAVMVLAEVLNSSAFSTNTSETETSRSSYVGAWNKLLETGYHVAPSSDQDNHCANWGLSFSNRTGVLLPNGVVLSEANFLDALRARHVFATEDKTGQLVLTGNGNLMGGRYSNSGTLTLEARYASSNGQTAQRVQFFEGVPGRNGTVTQLAEGSDTYTFTPADGEHFYYALVTQANGLRLWSAPIWVSQNGAAPADTTPPSVSASESGSSGSITLSATASDNVGVTKVEFTVDGVLKGSDTTSPYALSLDSTTLADGSHTLVAKAYDAAGNVGSSAGVTFSTSNSTGGATVLSKGVALGGQAATTGNQLYYTLAVPAGATNLSFSTSGGSGDADLYVKFGATPTTSSYDCRPYVDGNAETCTFATPSAGTWYVMLDAYSSFSAVTLVGDYTAAGGGGSTQTYTNGSNVSIPDNNSTGVTSSITVSGRSGNASASTAVTVHIVHTYIGDLIVDLLAPDGTVYTLSNRSGGSADNIDKTYTVNLSSEALNGTWKLRVTDLASVDTGYIDSWSITF